MKSKGQTLWPAPRQILRKNYTDDVRRSSVSISLTDQHISNRSQHNTQIQNKRPTFYIKNIHSDAPLHIFNTTSFTAKTIHLRKSGNPRLHLMPPPVIANNFRKLFIQPKRMRSRPDNRHISPQHIYKLRQLVDICPPDKPPQPSNSRISRRSLLNFRI